MILNTLNQVIKALQGTFANGSDELDQGIGTADGTLVKVKMPDGSFKTISSVVVQKDGNNTNEVVINLD